MLQNCIHYKFGCERDPSAIARARIGTLIRKSHTSQTVTRLPSSSHNHHLNNGLLPWCPLVTPTTTNILGCPPTTTTARQQNTTTTRPHHHRQRQRMRPPRRPLPHHATPTTNKPSRPIDNHMHGRQQAANHGQHPMNDIDHPATAKTTSNGCRTTSPRMTV